MVKAKVLLAAGLSALVAANPVTYSPVAPSATTDVGTLTIAPGVEVTPPTGPPIRHQLIPPTFNASNLLDGARDMAEKTRTQTPSFTTIVGNGTRTTSHHEGTELQTLDSRYLRPGEVVLGCHGKCPKIVRKIDLSLPVPTHSCVRDALTALANWRKYCDNADRWNLGKNFANAQNVILCFNHAPDVETCCGKWVEKDDRNTFGVLHPSESGTKKQVIQRGWDEYNIEYDRCRRFRPENDEQYIYYMQNLDRYDIEDADDTGRVINSFPPRYNPEGEGFMVTRNNYLAV
ncbi:hypothetical protein LTS07_005630 [Exophiala sideris]|uniref:Ecp2 effector protein domain-containing protein n=1 Tax=Exophiala sideris TaxID=1016849 RepID=A0ABR0J7T7_9EURO|nr:hypothetical protein LTS07_005630 [Exophiala sideris]KAK5031654.1 hypothetical protein LTR13_007644 [Exophiala sideris]KAK5058332.1 hypothetical protein LTR69_006737 [Exophiala sideris]KAK5180261.1 hypothetical protein LTR44_007387 [Eurotiomycetes sp. CCFEE 6388]